ncbi:O-methyltransferase [Marinobacterium aestuariivivens]|uniref:O-methyltransferase n=1 Tax=Marinobacterium aestuariivivens TaxID=1698799 RepID=A0ABW1ZXU6_9GAMM
MDLEKFLSDLEELGARNDSVQSDRSKKYLNITPDTGEFLSVLIKATQAKTVLEVGTSNGYSTLWLASAVPDDGHVYTIEYLESKAREARINFEKAGLDRRITQLVGDASQELSKVPDPVDFIFLDADRSSYLALAKTFFALLKPGGLLVCDNAVSHESELSDFVDWIRSRSDLSMSRVPVGKGELLIYKESI